jgi:hypothetical protein
MTNEKKEYQKKYQKEYRKKNKNKAKEYAKNYYKKNKDKCDERDRLNREKKNEYHKLPENKLKKNERTKKRRKSDIDFKIRDNLSGRLKMALNRNQKSGKTMELLGCSIPEFKKYFESKFIEGMTWEKYLSSEIQADHIIPCASFDLSLEEAQKFCFHYTNLQPLWAADNNAKKNKIDFKYLIDISINPNILKEKYSVKLLNFMNKNE